MQEDSDRNLMLFLSSFPPRRCGIATFTQDLSNSFNELNGSIKSKIIAINDNGTKYDYDGEVLFDIHEQDADDYREAARKINGMDNVKMVNIQHEFKLFGSYHGENLLPFLEEIDKPVITTFHCVLPFPSQERKDIVREISEKSEYVVVMTGKAKEILMEDYDMDETKIRVIPHGVHDVRLSENGNAKESLGYSDKTILMSFGLLRPGNGQRSSGRGYEFVLDSLPEIIKEHPDILYLIVGVTHPKYLKTEGEAYREMLRQKVKDLRLEDHVEFINKYVNLEELFTYLQASDVYICSNLNPHQVTSGTLAYAMSCGCVVVSTPFFHAKEAVTPERGILIEDFGNPKLFSRAVNRLLSDKEKIESMGRSAYQYTRAMIWPKVANQYMQLLNGHSK